MTKSIQIAAAFLLLAAPFMALATGGSATRGQWACQFLGREWQHMPGHTELRPVLYSSRWQANRTAAYNEAQSQCQNWSDTNCHFQGCKQKSKR